MALLFMLYGLCLGRLFKYIQDINCSLISGEKFTISFIATFQSNAIGVRLVQIFRGTNTIRKENAKVLLGKDGRVRTIAPFYIY